MTRLVTDPFRAQRGMALVEAAIALPLVLLVLIPVGEITRLFVQYSTLAHHTRSAVRYVAERAISDTTGKPVITPALTTAAQNIVVYGAPMGGGEPVIDGLIADGSIERDESQSTSGKGFRYRLTRR